MKRLVFLIPLFIFGLAIGNKAINNLYPKTQVNNIAQVSDNVLPFTIKPCNGKINIDFDLETNNFKTDIEVTGQEMPKVDVNIKPAKKSVVKRQVINEVKEKEIVVLKLDNRILYSSKPNLITIDSTSLVLPNIEII